MIMKTVNTDQIVLCVHCRDGRKGRVCECVCMCMVGMGARGDGIRMINFHLLIEFNKYYIT